MPRDSCFVRSIAVLLMLSIAGFGAAALVTLHYHILVGGLVVAHSHPLSGDNQRNTHDHSEHEYAELNAASQLLETIVIPPVLDGQVNLGFLCYTSLKPVPMPATATVWHNHPRGPPSVFLSA